MSLPIQKEKIEKQIGNFIEVKDNIIALPLMRIALSNLSSDEFQESFNALPPMEREIFMMGILNSTNVISRPTIIGHKKILTNIKVYDVMLKDIKKRNLAKEYLFCNATFEKMVDAHFT